MGRTVGRSRHRGARTRSCEDDIMCRIEYQLGKLVGHVVSNKMQKTVVVQIPYFWRHPKYTTFIRRRTRLFAHDEYELCNVGDVVLPTHHPIHSPTQEKSPN